MTAIATIVVESLLRDTDILASFGSRPPDAVFAQSTASG
jgi:hypothetical protein